MPQSIEFQEQLGDDVRFLFIESQNHGMDAVEKMILTRKWFSDHAMWTTEAPFDTGDNTLPHTIVLGIDGAVIYNGKPSSKVEELVLEQVKLAKKGPKDLPAVCAKAIVEFDKGNAAAAIKALDALNVVTEGAAGETAAATQENAAAKKLATTLRSRADGKIAALAWMIDNGEFERADKLAPALAKSVAGLDRQEAKVKELTDKLASQSLGTEREASKALAKVWSKLEKDGLDSKSTPAIVKALNGVAEKFPATAAGKRATHLVQIVQMKQS